MREARLFGGRELAEHQIARFVMRQEQTVQIAGAHFARQHFDERVLDVARVGPTEAVHVHHDHAIAGIGGQPEGIALGLDLWRIGARRPAFVLDELSGIHPLWLAVFAEHEVRGGQAGDDGAVLRRGIRIHTHEVGIGSKDRKLPFRQRLAQLRVCHDHGGRGKDRKAHERAKASGHGSVTA